MCSPYRRNLAILGLVIAFSTAAYSQATPLKVCADPANLPFSSRQQSGFDNKIAEIIGAQLGRPVEFTWGRMGRGFIREYVNKGHCELLLGVPKGMRGVLVTRPYYRSSYVFVTPAGTSISSLDDVALRKMKIGVQILDDDYAPPAIALTRRGLLKNIVGFDMEAPGEVIQAVANKKVGAAIVWGPTAAFYARKYGRRIRITPVTPELDPPGLPMAYDIGIGVRKNDQKLFEQVDAAVAKAAPRIRAILKNYNVPDVTPRPTLASGGE